MRFPDNVPASVRHAIGRYVTLRRLLISGVLGAAGLAAVALLTLGAMVIDRFVELSIATRMLGPMAAWILLLATGMAILLWLLMWRPRPLSIAIRLDRALPQNRDAWSTSLDLALRNRGGLATGHADCVARVHEEAAALPATRVSETLNTRGLLRAGAALLLVLLGGLALHASGTFNVPLLWQRFWSPHANLPRDSVTQIELLSSQDEPLPEGSTARIEAAVERLREARPPRLELLDADGQLLQTIEMTQAREQWVYELPRRQHSFTWRIRAGDGLTRRYHQAVTPRIRIDRVLHDVRFPRYTDRPAIEAEPLATRRLSLLDESRVTLHIHTSDAYQSLTATFEPLAQANEAAVPLTGDELLAISRKGGQEEAPAIRRTLRVSQRDARTGRLSLRIDESGVLRLRATGENGLESEPWVLVIEAIADAPPRVTITGVELETTIMPGEVVAFQYRAEDDLAIEDLMMAWWTAGPTISHDFAGEEYIRSEDFGSPTVSGQELIQRMNYRVYATTPFEFQLIAVDSKGQEAKSEKYSIHIIDDDHAARFKRAMEFLETEAKNATNAHNLYRELSNRLNIVRTAAGESETWPENQNELLQELIRRSGHVSQGYDFQRSYFTQRYAGFPWRIDRAIARLMAARQMLPTSGDLLGHIDTLREPNRLQEGLQALTDALAAGQAQAKMMMSAAEAERKRFTAEQVLQAARKLIQRFQALAELRDNPALHAANLEFYAQEITTMLDALDADAEQLPELGEVKAQLRSATEESDAPRIQALLGDLADALAAHRPPLTSETQALMEHLRERAQADQTAKTRLQAAAAFLLSTYGQETPLVDSDIILMGQQVADNALPEDWHQPNTLLPPTYTHQLRDLQHSLHSFHLDIRTGRHDLYPQAMYDREAELREQALVVASLVQRAPVAAPRRQQLLERLTPFMQAGFAEALTRPDPPTLQALSETLPADDNQPQPTPAMQAIATMLQAIADDAQAHSERLQTLVDERELTGDMIRTARLPFADDAARLQRRMEGAEALYRAALHTFMHQRLSTEQQQALPPWSYWQPLHGIQLALTTLALRTQEIIHGRHLTNPSNIDDHESYNAITARNASRLAEEIRTYAALIQPAIAGTAIDHDFAPIIAESKTTGYLENLATEYAYVAPYLQQPPRPASAEELAALRESQLGRIALHERALLTLETIIPELAQAPQPPRIAELLAQAAAAIPDADHQALREDLAQTQALATADTTEPELLARQLQQRVRDLRSATAALRAQVRLPALNTTGSKNRRFTTTRGIPYLWTIAMLIENYDRRWLQALQRTELDLVRALLDQAYPAATPPPPRALRHQYIQMIELRARNLANEQRRNRGISFLQQEGGPSIKLPPHIANEFFKGRNRESPAAYRERIESYYNDLYRDLSQ